MNQIKYFILSVFICAFLPFAGSAQINTVRNPGFEQYVQCPFFASLVNFANNWSAIVDTSFTLDTNFVYHGNHGNIMQYDGNCIPYYCNACDNDSLDPSHTVTVPKGEFYYHYPRTGNGMMYINMYENLGGLEDRYYLQGHLYNHLIAGQTYCVSFYVVLGGYSGDGCNHIGAYFDDGTIDTTTECGHAHPEYVPQVFTDSIITDTTNWTKIQGSFVATGTEKFITIGNFSDNAHTSILACNSHGHALQAGYLIDDVSVISTTATANAGVDKITSVSMDSVWVGDSTGYLPCYWYSNGRLIDSNRAGFKAKPDTTTKYVMALNVCGTITYDTMTVYVWKAGVKDPAPKNEVRLYPNPTTGNLTIEGAAGCSIVIYDMVGRVQNCNGMYSCRGSAGLTMTGQTITNNKQVLDISNLQKGIYIVEVVYEDGERVRRRVVKE